jgi:hypothetical protein
MPTLIYFLSFIFIITSSDGTYNVPTDPQAVMYHTIAHDWYGTVTLYAHEDLAGGSFDELTTGDIITLAYPERKYIVTGISRYRATDPTSIYSYFVDLDNGASYGSVELGKLIYDNNDLTLQTCIEQDGNENWGRLFVMAESFNERKYAR